MSACAGAAGAPRSQRMPRVPHCWIASGSPISRSVRHGGLSAANSSGWRWPARGAGSGDPAARRAYRQSRSRGDGSVEEIVVMAAQSGIRS